MRELLRKVVELGLLDRQTARLFELWKALPNGVEAMARRAERLKAASPTQLRDLIEELGELVDSHLEQMSREVLVDLPTSFPLQAHIVRGSQDEWTLPAAIFGGSVIMKLDGEIAHIPRYGDNARLSTAVTWGRVNLTTIVSNDLAVVETVQ